MSDMKILGGSRVEFSPWRSVIWIQLQLTIIWLALRSGKEC